MILIKIGGSAIDNIENIIENLLQKYSKQKIIIVHGGGKSVTQTAELLGKKQQWVVSPTGQRSRYTDKETMQIFQMVMAGNINKEIVRLLQKNGKQAIGLCGADANLIQAERKKNLIVIENGKKIMIEGGYTGKITQVNAELLQSLVEQKIIPVIAPIALGKEFEMLNVDGDRLAAAICNHLEIEQIIFITDVDGILDEKGKTISSINRQELQTINVGFGMQKKIMSILEAKAKTITIVNGLNDLSGGTVIE
ncbi:MAG: [LysW]-aminoadipate/[LysW]-glutamate kinase [archaeon]|nr:[LysW]-aminoadipate/[LysW]-glutamate kinase [archaeon]